MFTVKEHNFRVSFSFAYFISTAVTNTLKSSKKRTESKLEVVLFCCDKYDSQKIYSDVSYLQTLQL